MKAASRQTRHITDECSALLPAGDMSDTQAETVKLTVLILAMQVCALYVKLICAPEELAEGSI